MLDHRPQTSDRSPIPLWVKSHYSFLEGASFPEELVETAAAQGCTAMALTDRNGVYGLVRAFVKAQELGIRLICGAEVTVSDSPNAARLPRHGLAADADRLVLLAATQEGYGRLCRLLSIGHLRGDKGEARVSVEEISALAEDLLALCPAPRLLRPLHDAFGDRLYAAVARHLRPSEPAHEAALLRASEPLRIPWVAAPEILYHDRTRRPLQDVVTCLRHGRTLSEAGTVTRANAEHDLKDRAALRTLYEPALLARTHEIADRCTFGLGQIRYRYPTEQLPRGETAESWLRQLTWRGAARRFPEGIADDVRTQLERELALIEELEYGGYFLTMHEIVQWCRHHDILCQGRGSAANSAVCFCLGITAVDPVKMDLLFERFLSRERAEPPDIDLDIEHERREEVIQHVYQRYGRRHAAMVANVIRYRIRSAVRDVGKVLGIPQTDLDAAARLLRHRGDGLDGALLADAGFDPEAPATRQLLALSGALLDFPRHLSIHPGGFLLGHVPVDTLVPIEPATMEDRTVIQWDKYDVEALALFKVDLLGLGALTAIHRAFELLHTHEGRILDIATIPTEDAATYEMITAADTVGVFQIESRAQMAMLPRLRPKTFYDLVIEVAIVRPGPIQGNMVHPYLQRRKDASQIRYPHPSLERVLKRTLGVPIFQEQVMKLAVLAADYTPGEADQLRRDMAAWRRGGRIEQHRERLVSRMIAKGISEEFAERVFSQIRGFGEYGFPESHAASFALLAYVTSWLKCNHPAVFTCAMLDAQPMGFYAPATLIEDVQRHGVEVRPVDARVSDWDCALEPSSVAHPSPWAIRMGLRFVKGLQTSDRDGLRAARLAPDFETFVRQSRLGERSLTALAEAGAFESFGLHRRDALWAVKALAKGARDPLASAPSGTQTSFAALTPDEAIAWDYRVSAHSTRGHPMTRYRAWLTERRIPTAAMLRAKPDKTRLDYVGLVITRQRPGTASGVTFFTMEDETGFVNLVVWRDVFDRHATIAKTAVLLGVSGELQVSEGVTHLIAKTLWLPPFSEIPARRSRDFH